MAKSLKISFYFAGLFVVVLSSVVLYTLSLVNVLPQKVYVGKVSLSKLTKKEIFDLLQQETKKMPPYGLALKVGRKALPLSVQEINLKWQVNSTVESIFSFYRQMPLWKRWMLHIRGKDKKKVFSMQYRVDKKKLRRLLTEKAILLKHPPKDAAINFEKKSIISEEEGRDVDIDKWEKRIERHLRYLDFSPIQTAFHFQKARISKKMLKDIDLQKPLSQFQTRFNPAKKQRSYNVYLAVKSFDSAIVMPGETFSYNQVVGPRTKSKGYLLAPVIVGGKLVPDYGGGACQVSTTLFNAVLRAGMEVTKRVPHSRPSSYVPLGMDATVAYDYIDFAFKNTLSFPIVLHTGVTGNKVWVEIYGKKDPDIQVEIHRKVKKVLPNKIVKKQDDTLPPGTTKVEEKGNQGYVVVLEQVVHQKDQSKTRRFMSRYAPHTRVELLGPPLPTETEEEEQSKENEVENSEE